MIYGKKIKQLRKKHNLKQIDIAEQLEIGRRTYGNYETEAKFIPVKHLNTLANLYNVSIDYIFGLTNEINYKHISKEINIESVSIKLKVICKDKEIKQEALALTLHISQGTISRYLNGRNPIPLINLYSICKKYHISADYLLGKIDNPKYLNSTKK